MTIEILQLGAFPIFAKRAGVSLTLQVEVFIIFT